MDNQSSKFKMKLGLFVLIGFGLFLTTIFLIGRQKHLFDPVFRLSTTFRNVSGLQVGNNIRFSGIDVGTVESIELINDSTVRVGMIIKKSVQPFIKSDCRAAIGSEGIIGDRVLILSQGTQSSGRVQGEDFLSSVEPVETDEIMSSLKVTSGNFEVISDQLSEIMIKINNGNGALGRLIQDSVLSENINKTILNLRESSKGMNENMEAAKSSILLRRYYNKKEKEAEKKVEKSVQDTTKVQKDSTEKKKKRRRDRK